MQASLLTNAAMRAGFSGGLVVDFPHSTRAKKYFLVLMVGPSAAVPQAKGLDGEDSAEEDAVVVHERQQSHKRRKGSHVVDKVVPCSAVKLEVAKAASEPLPAQGLHQAWAVCNSSCIMPMDAAAADAVL